MTKISGKVGGNFVPSFAAPGLLGKAAPSPRPSDAREILCGCGFENVSRNRRGECHVRKSTRLSVCIDWFWYAGCVGQWASDGTQACVGRLGSQRKIPSAEVERSIS